MFMCECIYPGTSWALVTSNCSSFLAKCLHGLLYGLNQILRLDTRIFVHPYPSEPSVGCSDYGIGMDGRSLAFTLRKLIASWL